MRNGGSYLRGKKRPSWIIRVASGGGRAVRFIITFHSHSLRKANEFANNIKMMQIVV